MGLSSAESRVEELLEQLSPAERIAMLHQRGPAVERLRLKEFRTGTEALHGVAWNGLATVFPQPVGLAASWHPELLERIGTVVGTEVRAKHAADPLISLNVWAPVVNLLRDPRWGRNEEGYSEDPWLTVAMATAYCRGLRGGHEVARVAPVLKHVLAYNNEDERSVTSSGLRPRVLREYDLPVFDGPIRAGVVDGMMPAYNLINGRPAHVAPYLAQLRAAAGRELLVVSDAEAPYFLVELQQYAQDQAAGHAAVLLAGVDSFTEGGPDPALTVGSLTEALERGLIGQADIDRAARRILLLRARTGEFDPAADPYAGIGPDALDRPEHRALAREAAREQVVLLKNDGALPLAPGRIALIGPLAHSVYEDWYSGTMPYRTTIADGLGAVAGVDLTVAEAVDRIALVAAAGPVSVDEGELPTLRAGGADPEHFDVFEWGAGIVTLRAAGNGRYLTGKDESTEAAGRALVADQVQPHDWFVQEMFRLHDRGDGRVLLQHAHSGRFVTVAPDGALFASAEREADAEPFRRLPIRDGAAQARAAARDADAVVLVLGNDPHINGRETQDRTTLAFPPAQQALIDELAGPRTTLVVMSSYPYALDDSGLAAVVWTSHAGQETGNAVADVLLGAHAPTGRLPQTWYRDDQDLPPILDYDVIKAGWTYQYFAGTPLYPFGHGLTYTTFGYGPARAELDGDIVSVSVEVTNTGGRAGVEVVQVYSRFTGDTPDRPVRRLQGFARVALEPGRTATAEVTFPLTGLAHWDVVTHRLRVEPGGYELLAGRSATAIEARTEVKVEGEPAGPRPVTGVAAVDFDDYAGIALADRTREGGDVVESPDSSTGDPAWLLFRDADLRARPSTLTAGVSRTEPGQATLELRADAPDGPVLATVAVPSTGGRYAWTTVTAPVTGAEGVRDLYLVLDGAFRLDRFGLS